MTTITDDAAWAAARAVELCPAEGGCVAVADESSAVHLRWAANAPTTGGATTGRRLTVAAIAGEATGVAAWHGDWDEDSVAALVAAATETARRAQPSPDASPLVPAWKSEECGVAPSAGLDALLPGLTTAFERARSGGRLLYGYAEHQVRTSCVASSTGLRLRHVQPSGVLDLTARRAGHPASAWTGSGAPEPGDPVEMAGRLDKRLDRPVRSARLPPGRYEVLLPPSGTADLMLHLYEALAAWSARSGQSVFSGPDGSTRLGQRLSDAALTLYSDPAEPGLECAPFAITRASTAAASVFDNGLPLTRTDWITGGVLTALTRTRASAAADGLPCTPGIGNLVLRGEDRGRTLEEMVAGTERGLLLTSLWYLRDVDPRALLLTGVTRDGVYLVERGEVTAAVPDFRFNESPVALLGRVTETGRTEPALPREWGEWPVRTAMPALRISDFGVAGPAS
jgi:predicted Zn-dependent protease